MDAIIHPMIHMSNHGLQAAQYSDQLFIEPQQRYDG